MSIIAPTVSHLLPLLASHLLPLTLAFTAIIHAATTGTPKLPCAQAQALNSTRKELIFRETRVLKSASPESIRFDESMRFRVANVPIQQLGVEIRVIHRDLHLEVLNLLAFLVPKYKY